MSDIVEAWLWRDPGEIIERLLRRQAPCERHIESAVAPPPERRPRDRYYTQARRLHVQQMMKERA